MRNTLRYAVNSQNVNSQSVIAVAQASASSRVAESVKADPSRRSSMLALGDPKARVRKWGTHKNTSEKQRLGSVDDARC